MATCTLACETQEAIIRYTTNGVDPTETDTVYSVPFTVETGVTVKAKAWKDGMISSAVASAEATEVLQPTSVPIGSVLSDGSVVIYDRGSTYGDYNLTGGVLTRLSEGVDDESASSNNWRFLIADSADMEGNNGGTGDNKYWATVGGSIPELNEESNAGYGLPNTNLMLNSAYANDGNSLWNTLKIKRTTDSIDWFVPSLDELDSIYENSENLDNLAQASYFSSNAGQGSSYCKTMDFASGETSQVTSVESTDCRVRLLRRY